MNSGLSFHSEQSKHRMADASTASFGLNSDLLVVRGNAVHFLKQANGDLIKIVELNGRVGDLISQIFIHQRILATLSGDSLNADSHSKSEIHFRDPSTLDISHTISPHSGGISSIDFNDAGHLMITCGYSIR